MKKLLESFEKGIGQGLGLLLIFTLAFGVYAFVEPSSGPTSDFYFDPESPITSNTTLQFVGYTGTTNGNIGSIAGGNADCDALYEGSRWMTYDDFLRISHQYNYTYEVWVPNAVEMSGTFRYARDGGGSAIGSSGEALGTATCFSFTDSSTIYDGITLETDGSLDPDRCDLTRRLACVKGQ